MGLELLNRIDIHFNIRDIMYANFVLFKESIGSGYYLFIFSKGANF